MSRVAIILKKFNETLNTNYSLVMHQNLDDEYVATLYDDRLVSVTGFISQREPDAFNNAITYIRNEIGEIKDIIDRPTDPAIIAMIQTLRAGL